MSTAPVFLVDDDPFQLLYLGEILRSAGYFVEGFVEPAALLSRLTPRDRGCIVLDWQMPGLNGLELHKTLSARQVQLPVIFVSGSADIPIAVAAMRQGAVHFLTKPVAPAALLEMVAHSMQKDAVAAAERAARTQARMRWLALSPREQDVCRLCTRGLLIKQISAALNLSESTVQAHRARALAKLCVEGVVELVRVLDLVGDEPAN